MGSSGGGSVPAPPSLKKVVKHWGKALPKVWKKYQKYLPKQQELDLERLRKMMLPTALEYRKVMQELYPESDKIQEDLAERARVGMSEGLADWEKKQLASDLAGVTGNQAGSGMWRDQLSRGMLAATKQRQDHWAAMAQGLRTPLVTGQAPQDLGWMKQFTPNAAMNYTAQTYAPYAQAMGSVASQGNPWMGLASKAAGGLLGGIGMGIM